MPPEYVTKGLFSEKSDVFSFGVLLLEILSGKKSRTFDKLHPHKNLLIHHVRTWILSFLSKVYYSTKCSYLSTYNFNL